MKKWILLLAAAALLAASPAGAQTPPPNIVFFIVDDMAQEMITNPGAGGAYFLPFITSKKGIARKFANTYFTLSLCVPSRVSMLTGMYPHNNGVTDNAGSNGGYAAYMANGLDLVSWPKALQPLYYTGLFGKVLNGYAQDSSSIPDGFDRWFAQIDGVLDMFTWRANKDGVITQFTDNGSDDTYMTDVIARQAVSWINKKGTTYTKPFAFIVSPPAPHEPAIPAREFAGLYAAEPCQPCAKPSFNEANVVDKNAYGESLPLMGAGAVANAAAFWRQQIESARSLDKAFQLIWEALDAKGELANTFIVFVPDNGLMAGEHRLTKKIVPYLESIRSSTYVWGPGVVAGTDPSIISVTDWFPTFMEAAGLPIPSYVDGRSLLTRLQGGGGAVRKSFYVRGIPPTNPGDDTIDTHGWTFDALVVHDSVKDSVYVNYASGDDHEYFDNLADPYQLLNKWGTTTGTFRNASQAKIDAIKACVGRAQCQPLEDAAAPVP